jgi:hypothetical protein
MNIVEFCKLVDSQVDIGVEALLELYLSMQHVPSDRDRTSGTNGKRSWAPPL